jgi:CelD/BcsL family acetyltransferase involved in cellulose biosynthesis
MMPFAEANGAIASDWFALVRSCRADLSMSPQWFASTVISRNMQSRAEVFAVSRDGALVAVVPHVRREETLFGVKARSREMTGSYLVAYHPAVVSSIEIEQVLDLLCAQSASDTDVIVLPNLEVGGPTAAAARSLAARLGLLCTSRAGHSSPHMKLSGGWEEFLAGKPKKFRYKVRTFIKDLEGAGKVTERWFENDTVMTEFVPDMLAIEAHSWKARAGMAISGSEMESEYYRLLLPFLAAEQAVHANILYLDGTPVAYSLCYRSHGEVRQLKTSYDERYGKLSPGAVTHQLAIRKAFETGASEFDFLGDVMQHKNQWASGVREHETLYLFLHSWRGRFVGRGRQLVQRIRDMRRKPDVAAAEAAAE